MSDKDEQNTSSSSPEESIGISVHDLAQKMSLPENTLRKYLAYFNLPVEKLGRKNYLNENTEHCLSEILQLKNNGWSLKQIKAFRDEQEQNKQNALAVANEEAAVNPIEPISVGEVVSEPVSEVVQPEAIIQEEKPEVQIQSLEQEVSANEVVLQEAAEPAVAVETNESSASSEELRVPVQAESEVESLPPSQRHADEQSDGDYEEQPSEDPFKQIQKPPLTKDFVNKEIATQAKRASRLYRFLSSRNSPKDSAELKADLDRRVEFLNGLRYLRDNWLDRSGHSREEERERDLAVVNGN